MSQHNGAGNSVRAFEIVKSAMVFHYSMVVFFALVMYAFIPTFAHVASYDLEVREYILSCRSIMAISFLVCQGATIHMELLFKQGRVFVVTAVMSSLNWFIGIPLAFFGARIWGLPAIWGGVMLSYLASHAILAYKVYHSDWHAVAVTAASISDAKVM